MTSTKGFVLGILTAALLLGGAMLIKNSTCHTAIKDPVTEFANVPDTTENRLRAAQLVVDAYPTQKFGIAVAARVEQVVGKDVTDEARRQFRAKTDVAEFTAQRAQFLAKVFTPTELAALASLLSTPTGQAAFEKLPQHDELWRQHLSPVLVGILSGQG